MSNERYVTLDAILPTNPQPGEIVVLPEDQVGGASTINFIYMGDQHIGHTEQFARVSNVSDRSFLARTVTTEPFLKDLLIRLICEQYTFKSLIFVDYFGWSVHEYNPTPKILLDETFEIVYAVPLKKKNSELYTYDRVYLKKSKEKPNATANRS